MTSPARGLALPVVLAGLIACTSGGLAHAACPPGRATGARGDTLVVGFTAGLTSVAKAAQQQIPPIVQRLTGVIDQAQSADEQALATGKAGLLTQLTTARQSVEAAARTAATQADKVLATLERQLATQAQAAAAQIQQLTAPALAQAGQVVSQASAALAQLVQQSEASVAAIEARLSLVTSRFDER